MTQRLELDDVWPVHVPIGDGIWEDYFNVDVYGYKNLGKLSLVAFNTDQPNQSDSYRRLTDFSKQIKHGEAVGYHVPKALSALATTMAALDADSPAVSLVKEASKVEQERQKILLQERADSITRDIEDLVFTPGVFVLAEILQREDEQSIFAARMVGAQLSDELWVGQRPIEPVVEGVSGVRGILPYHTIIFNGLYLARNPN